MPLLLSTLLVGLAVLLLWKFAGPEVTGVALSAAGVIASFAADQIRNGFKKFFRRYWPESSASAVAKHLRRAASAFSYADFSLVLVSLIILCMVLINSFLAEVGELAAKQYLSFGPKEGGVVYLQLQIASYVYMPVLLLAMASYGFYRGARDGRILFRKLLFAILLGLAMGACLASLLYGGFTGLENYEKVKEVMPESAPSGTEMTAPVTLFGVGLTFLIGYAFLGWLFGLLGRLVRRSSSSLDTGSSAA